MLAVRYVTLLALVVWLGAMIALGFGDVLRQQFHLVAFACGAVILTCLFVMKFVGPPPHSFVPRLVIVALMLAIAVYSRLSVPRTAALLVTINMALGAVLLAWYVRE